MYNITLLADLETKYIKLDKKLCPTTKKTLFEKLLCRYTDKNRFINLSLVENNRISSVDTIACREIGFTPYEQALYGLCHSFNIDVSYYIKNLREYCDIDYIVNIKKEEDCTIKLEYDITTKEDCDIELEYNIKTRSRECLLNLVFDIEQKNLSCELLSGISLTEKILKACDYNITKYITDEACEKYYNELVYQKSCPYTKSEYNNLVSLGFMPDIIQYTVNQSVFIDPKERTLKTNDHLYSLTDELCFTSPTFNGIKDPVIFLEKTIKDLPENIKEQIINSI